MKKMLLVLAVLVASATSTFAVTPDKTEVFYKLNNEKVFNGLMKYLQVNSEQAENLKDVFEATEMKIKNAERRGDEKAYDNAVVFNLANARYLLTSTQYRRYLTLINLTINNHFNYLSYNEK